MGKISIGGYDDGEGPSSIPFRKYKRRRVVCLDFADDDLEGPIGAGEEEEGEEQEHDDDGESEEHAADDEEESYFDDYERDETPCFAPPSNGNAGGNICSATDEGGRYISVKLTDPDVLDCCVCYEPLSAPVFQCENGHIACSNCCVRLGNKCPMCTMPIGYSRNRAMEKVLESIKISCPNEKYGCKETSSYSKKNDHEKECIYLPCLCPHSGCDFVASSKELSLHFSHRHVDSGIQFAYDHFFCVFLNSNDKTIVLQEQYDGTLFILHNNAEILGNIVKVSCIGPNSKARFHYDISAGSQGCSLSLHSFTKNIQGRIADAPSTGFLLIPSDFFGSSGQIKLKIRIKYNAAHPTEALRF